MKIAKALGIGTAAAAGVGVTTYGSIELTSKIKRNNFLNEANARASKIEEVWKDSFYALRGESEDRKWEWLYLRKVWEDGFDLKNQDPYKGLERAKWEEEYWKRINSQKTKITGAEFSKVKEIYGDDQKYNTKWKKFKEICLTWYAKWQDDGGEDASNDVQTSSGHPCLYSKGEIPWDELEVEYQKNTKKNPGDAYWERMKNPQSQPRQ